jgi:hypothetical protein
MIKIIVIVSVLLSSCIGNHNKDENNSDSASYQRMDQKQDTLKKSARSSDSAFLDYWTRFIDIVKNMNVQIFKEMSLDSIECDGKVKSFNDFTHSYFQKVFDSNLRSRLNDNTKIDFNDFEIEDDALKKYHLAKGKIISNIIKKASITKNDKYPDGPIVIVLEFVKTDLGYKFSGWEEFGSASTKNP